MIIWVECPYRNWLNRLVASRFEGIFDAPFIISQVKLVPRSQTFHVRYMKPSWSQDRVLPENSMRAQNMVAQHVSYCYGFCLYSNLYTWLTFSLVWFEKSLWRNLLKSYFDSVVEVSVGEQLLFSNVFGGKIMLLIWGKSLCMFFTVLILRFRVVPLWKKWFSCLLDNKWGEVSPL